MQIIIKKFKKIVYIIFKKQLWVKFTKKKTLIKVHTFNTYVFFYAFVFFFVVVVSGLLFNLLILFELFFVYSINTPI